MAWGRGPTWWSGLAQVCFFPMAATPTVSVEPYLLRLHGSGLLSPSPASANDTWCLAVSFCGSLLQIESEGLPDGFCAFSKSSDVVREKEAHFLTWAQPVTVLGQRLRPQALLCHHCSSTAHLTCRTKGEPRQIGCVIISHCRNCSILK